MMTKFSRVRKPRNSDHEEEEPREPTLSNGGIESQINLNRKKWGRKKDHNSFEPEKRKKKTLRKKRGDPRGKGGHGNALNVKRKKASRKLKKKKQPTGDPKNQATKGITRRLGGEGGGK